MNNGVMDSTYAEGRLKRPELVYRYQVRALAALNAAPEIKNGALLDLGCADGLTLKELIRIGHPSKAVGIEMAPDLAEIARSNGLDIIEGNVEELPVELENDSFDVVTALALLEHLDHPDKCLKEVSRVLKPGGIFVASSPNPFWDEMAEKMGIHKEKAHHVVDMKPEVFHQLCRENGLNYIQTIPFMLVFTAFLPYLKLKPDPNIALFVDELLANKYTSPFYVNQLFTARKGA
ncbi:class I SAM-dependent methyltransferase [Myxococcota bacterium]|nr:class I SAM-dependent methyltransferase [Myxococcota bacterium]MBU1381810.1 class I SAM-dependent methyltransferase [Myxococcota bacterium]MBU1498587.1 class I SAM-dependent methyltransferase [Myxococcota bacterium]